MCKDIMHHFQGTGGRIMCFTFFITVGLLVLAQTSFFYPQATFMTLKPLKLVTRANSPVKWLIYKIKAQACSNSDNSLLFLHWFR